MSCLYKMRAQSQGKLENRNRGSVAADIGYRSKMNLTKKISTAFEFGLPYLGER